MANEVRVPNDERIAEMWAAVKLLLASKVDTATLANYPTVEAVITTITQALASYPTDTEMQEEITAALVDYMTTSQINEAIAEAVKEGGLHYEMVEELPEEGSNNVIYLLANGTEGADMYDEWYYYNGRFERIGSTGVDLSNYWSKDDLQIMTSEELEEILK